MAAASIDDADFFCLFVGVSRHTTVSTAPFSVCIDQRLKAGTSANWTLETRGSEEIGCMVGGRRGCRGLCSIEGFACLRRWRQFAGRRTHTRCTWRAVRLEHRCVPPCTRVLRRAEQTPPAAGPSPPLTPKFLLAKLGCSAFLYGLHSFRSLARACVCESL